LYRSLPYFVVRVRCGKESSRSLFHLLMSFLSLRAVTNCPAHRVFHGCHGARPTRNQVFTINRCPCYQVIRIHSAEVGFSRRCPAQNDADVECMKLRTNYAHIKRCNGNYACSISRNILSYSPQNKLCAKHQNGNYIKITYDCINSK